MYMAANGRRQNPRKQVGADPVRGGNADKREPGTARTAATAECKPSPGRQCRQEFFGEFRKTGEISRFNLWRLISCAVRRKQVEPGTARTAEASGCRLSLLAAMPPNNLRRSAQIRRLRELQSMVPEVVCYPAAQVRAGSACPDGVNRSNVLTQCPVWSKR